MFTKVLKKENLLLDHNSQALCRTVLSMVIKSWPSHSKHYRIGGGEIEETNMVPSHLAVIVRRYMVIDPFRLNSRMQNDITWSIMLQRKLLLTKKNSFVVGSKKTFWKQNIVVLRMLPICHANLPIYPFVPNAFWPHRSGRPLRINLMSRYICFSQNGRFDVSFEELFSKVQNPGGFFRKNVF